MSCTIHQTSAGPLTVCAGGTKSYVPSIYNPKVQPIASNSLKNCSINDENNNDVKENAHQNVRSTLSNNLHYMAKKDLNDYQLEKITELRKRLGDELLSRTPIFNDDFSILRWLMGYDYKIDDIVPKFEKASNILRAMNLIDLRIEDINKANVYLSNFTSAANYFPGGIIGYDAAGNVLAMQTTGLSCPKTLSLCGRVSDVFRLTICETALIYQLIKLQERKFNRKLGLRVIVDLEGFNSDHIHTNSVKTYANALKYLQNIFPDITRQVYVINAPTMVTAAYRVVKSVLSEQSREKVVFLGSNYKQTLVNDIGVEYLYPKWGGNLQPHCGNLETGLLRIGGPPPCALRYVPEKNPAHILEEKLTILNVPARSKREITLDVPEGHNLRLHWFFVTSGDIEFAVFNSEGVEAWPQFRLTTYYVPEYGETQLRASGKHTIVFDNTFSTFFSKEVKYCVYIKNH